MAVQENYFAAVKFTGGERRAKRGITFRRHEVPRSSGKQSLALLRDKRKVKVSSQGLAKQMPTNWKKISQKS